VLLQPLGRLLVVAGLDQGRDFVPQGGGLGDLVEELSPLGEPEPRGHPGPNKRNHPQGRSELGLQSPQHSIVVVGDVLLEAAGGVDTIVPSEVDRLGGQSDPLHMVTDHHVDHLILGPQPLVNDQRGHALQLLRARAVRTLPGERRNAKASRGGLEEQRTDVFLVSGYLLFPVFVGEVLGQLDDGDPADGRPGMRQLEGPCRQLAEFVHPTSLYGGDKATARRITTMSAFGTEVLYGSRNGAVLSIQLF
jgi:hypothetical protein